MGAGASAPLRAGFGTLSLRALRPRDQVPRPSPRRRRPGAPELDGWCGLARFRRQAPARARRQLPGSDTGSFG